MAAMEDPLKSATDDLSKARLEGDAAGEAAALLKIADAVATLHAGMGLNDQAIRSAKQAAALFKKLGDPAGEKGALAALGRLHDAKGMDLPSSSYRSEALGLLRELVKAVEGGDAAKYDEVMKHLYGTYGGFFTQKDLSGALKPVLEGDGQDFLKAQAAHDAINACIEESTAGGKPDSEEQTGITFREYDKLRMYFDVRAGTLVYGPRFRQVNGYAMVPVLGVCAASVKPSSLCDEWELEGWDWNPCDIDAAVHSAFGMQQF